MQKVCTSKSDLRSNDFSIVGSYREILNYPIMTAMAKPIEVNNGLGKSQAKNNKKPPLPNPLFRQQQQNRPLRESSVSFLLLILQRYLLIYIFMMAKSFHSYEVKSIVLWPILAHKCQSVNNLLHFHSSVLHWMPWDCNTNMAPCGNGSMTTCLCSYHDVLR